MEIVLIIIPALSVVAVGLVGSKRRIGFWLAMLLAIVLTPIGGFLVAMISGPRKPKKPERQD
ncbi:MAG: hypothetical protein KC431_15255 [Myxococcales bacterium]|nr:hypothetical protein [Myxococcales bacterium]MCA9698880.1 hypothetical protein [Myxococcales bacterium]